MIQNLKLTLLVLTAFFVCLGSVANDVCADDYAPETFNAAQFTEYERQLNAILKTRNDEERLFVAKIVTLVKLGRIPSRLVSTSYQWGRKNRPDTNYPFIYFEKVIRLQAKALKLEEEIPVFDYSIYKSAGQRPEALNSSAGQRTDANRSFFSRRPIVR